MSSEQKKQRLAAALAAMAAEAKGREAPPGLEARLLAEFRARRAPVPVSGKRVSRWAWMTAAAAALGSAAIVLPLIRGQRVPPPPVPPAPKAAVEAQALAAPPLTHAAAVKPKRRPARTATPRVNAPEPAPADEGGFIPLPYAAELGPADALDVVRVKLPRSAVARFGFPVNAERGWEPVRADLAFGQDGLVRGIRFVK